MSSKVNCKITSFLYRAFLGSLFKKKNGSIYAIAVGCSFCRLVSILLCCDISETLADYLKPMQLGVGVECGCEAAIYATKIYFDKYDGSTIVLLKLGMSFSNKLEI